MGFSNSGDDSATPPASAHRSQLPSAGAAADSRAAGDAACDDELLGSDEDGPAQPPREIAAFDVQLARMLTAVSQAAEVSPAQLLQVLLNFAPEDYQVRLDEGGVGALAWLSFWSGWAGTMLCWGGGEGRASPPRRPVPV